MVDYTKRTHPAPQTDASGVRDALERARDFIDRVSGTALGIAMSGNDHPTPDGVLMDMHSEAMELSAALRAALQPDESADLTVAHAVGEDEPIGYVDPVDIGRRSSAGELLRFWCSPTATTCFSQPVYSHPSEQAVTEEPGTIERHDFGSKAGDPDWCYSCGEHRNHPAHAESQRPYPFTLLDLDIARIIDPSSFLPGADEQGQNFAIAKAKRITKAATAALGAQTPSTPTPPVAEAVAFEQVDYPRILYVCEHCQENAPEMCGRARDDLYVTPSGMWLCDECRDEEGVPVSDCVSPPALYPASTVARLQQEIQRLTEELAAVQVSNNKWLAKWERAEAQLAEANKALDAAGDFIDRVSGAALGIAMSGDNHPNPDEVLMDFSREGMALSSSIRAARRAREAQGGRDG